MKIIRDVEEMMALSRSWAGRTVGFVPTMGYLHRGHTSLMQLTRPLCEHLVVSIFVNPLQFHANEDLGRYPRDPEGDAQKCAAAGVDVLFIPEGFYPTNFRTRVIVSGVSSRWEGAERPGHFEGVATVVARLLGIVAPTVACFGEKDFQQLEVIRSMARDLALPVRILSGPLVRDDDGVALSSRNVYLSPSQRERARSLNRALFAIRDHRGTVGERLAAGAACVDSDKIDYLAIVDAEDLEPLSDDAPVTRPARAIVTARYGAVRLLDNVAIEPDPR